MERLNKIFAEWAKQDKRTELKSEKVELGLIDDLNKALDSSQDVIKNMKEQNILIKRSEGFLEKDKKEGDKLYATAKKAADVFFKLEDQFLAARSRRDDADKKVEANQKRQEEEIKYIEGFKKKKTPLDKKAQTLITVFEKNIKKAEAAAKDLGLKLPIAKYTKAQDDLRKNL